MSFLRRKPTERPRGRCAPGQHNLSDVTRRRQPDGSVLVIKRCANPGCDIVHSYRER